MKNKTLFQFPGVYLLLCLTFTMSLHTYSQESDKSCSKPKIEVKEVKSGKSLVIKTTVPTSEIGPKMGEMYGKLFDFLGDNNIGPTGPPFTVYYKFEPEGNTTFETGIPVAEEVEGNGEILFKKFPEMKVISTMYTGAYENMMPVYEALTKYLEENNLESDGTSWEIYLTDPNEIEDPNENQTLIYFPVK